MFCHGSNGAKQDVKGLAEKAEALGSTVEHVKGLRLLVTLAAGRDDETKLALVATVVALVTTDKLPVTTTARCKPFWSVLCP